MATKPQNCERLGLGLGLDADPPGSLARRELIATDYHALQPATPHPTQRHGLRDPWWWVGLGLCAGMVPLFVGGLLLQIRSLPAEPPKSVPIEKPATPPDDPDNGPPIGFIALAGLVGLGVCLAFRGSGEGHPDCPNHCPSDRPCQCGQRVSVHIELGRD